MQTEKKTAVSLVATMARKYGLDPTKFYDTLKSTIMKSLKDEKSPRDSDVATFMVVANKYNLDPFTKEIVAFPDKKGGIVPVVTVDGWISIRERAVKEKQFDYEEIIYSDNMIENEKGTHKPCWEWIEIHIYFKGNLNPMKVREYFDEVYVPPRKTQHGFFSGPWQTHTKRMMRHKVTNQGYRKAFGISGVCDEDEYNRIIEAQTQEIKVAPAQIQAPEEKTEEAPTNESALLSKTSASEKEMEILNKMSIQANMQDGDFFDFIAKNSKDPDEVKKDEYNIMLNLLGKKIDESDNEKTA